MIIKDLCISMIVYIDLNCIVCSTAIDPEVYSTTRADCSICMMMLCYEPSSIQFVSEVYRERRIISFFSLSKRNE